MCTVLRTGRVERATNALETTTRAAANLAESHRSFTLSAYGRSRYPGDIVVSRYREPIVKVPIGFPEHLYEWLRETAFRRREPMARLVREAVEEHRRRLDPQLDLPLHGR